MVNSIRSSQMAKDEENSNMRVTRSSEKGKINSHLKVSDTTGIRKSHKETSSKKIIANPMSTRKTRLVENRAPPTPAGRRKSESVEKEKMPSPLMRSGRTRSHSFSGPSDSKTSGSLASKKQKKEKSVEQLTFEAKEVNEDEGQDLGTSKIEIKRMHAHMYRALFKQHKKGCVGKANRTAKLNQEGNNDTGAKIDDLSKGSCSDHNEVFENDSVSPEDDKARETRVDSRLNRIAIGLVENSTIPDSYTPSNAPICETGVVPERVQPDCCGEDTLPISVSRNTILNENLERNSVGQDGGERLVPSKRKEVTEDMDSDVSASLSKDDNYSLIPDASSPPRSGGNILGTDGSCSKQLRLDYNPTLNESCDPCATEHQDGHDNEATMLQKDYPTNVAKNICLVCKGEGQLLSCGGKGCNGYYHLSCLEPPMPDAMLGVWHCQFCVKRKIELGVYSVSEGVESICDVKEASFPNVDGFSSQKEFLVKYKGLAHVHNRWVAENQLLLEAPLLLMKFNQKDQTPRLKPEWSLPHRLLQKRALILGKQHDDNHVVDDFDCCYEWLVKWRSLGYEHVTWELDNASFLRSSEGQSLIRGYEARFQRAKRVSLCSKSDKKQDRENSINILSQMPGGVSAGFSTHNLDAVNKLREHWHKGRNAIVIDDHDRILKVVAFILSLHSDTYRPFLIISTAASLHSWENEFYQTDPSIDVVIYNGNKEIRNNIMRLEFYDRERCILFQVLIVTPDVIVEDMSVLGGIEWEAIIVDECQSPKISSYFKQIRMLSTHLKILLFCSQLRDSIVENNMLALLDGQSDNEKDDLASISYNDVVQLKEKLSSYIAYKCKSDSSRFVEYWVPAQISHVQLEQYCATLLSNASILRSSLKVDSVGAIRDVLISTRKCCNHPYVVDQSTQGLLIKGLEEAEILGVGIKASGKLQLLDSMLMELRKNDLRALVLFQSIGGSGRDTIGDILDDYLRQRFGLDSFERIDKSLAPSKKQAAMKKFNDKNNGIFIFLLETSACLPSIKLSSIDTIIIFDSDWNPVNDIRSLQKITLDSQFESIKIFRLYTAFTVEEKALILAKQDKTLDTSFLNINRSTSHTLLMWGASCLFDELRVFHDGATSTSSVKSLFRQPLLEETVQKFSSILSKAGEDADEDTDTSNCSLILKVQQNGGSYRANFSLLGELKLGSMDEVSPQVFWSKLLEGKQFQWKYSCSSSQRSRKRVQHYGSLVDGHNLISEGIAKKRRKVSNNVVDQPSSKSEGENLCTEAEADRPQGNGVESEKKSKEHEEHDEQMSLHLSLKPEITKLCEVLLLPENVTKMAHNFLEYVMNNHHINREPLSILQAFQISLTWTAAALLKHKLDHKTSLILAKQNLKFDCKKGEVDYIYSMLRCLKKIFLYRTGSYDDTESPKASKSSNRVYPCSGVTQEAELFRKDLSKSIKEVRKKCEKHLKKIQLMQQEEKQSIKLERDEFDRRYKIELAFIRSCSPNDVMRTEKLKVLNVENEKMKCKLGTSLKVLEDNQSAQILKLQEWEATWVDDLKSWAQNELFNILSSKEHWTVAVSKNGANEVGIMVSEDRPVSGSEDHNITENLFDSQENNICEHSHSRGHVSDSGLKVLDREAPLDLPGTINTTDYPVNVNSVNSASSMEQISDGGALNEFSDGVLSSSCRTASLSIGLDNGSLLNPHLEYQNSGDSVSVLERQPQAEMPVTVNSTDCLPLNATPLSPPSPVDEISKRGVLDVPVLDCVLSSNPCQAASSSNSLDTISLSNPPVEQQIPDVVSLGISDGDIPVTVTENSHSIPDGDIPITATENSHSIPDGDILVTVPENSHAMANSHNDIEPSTDAVLVDKSTTHGQDEGVLRTVAGYNLSRETLATVSVNVMEPIEQGKQIASVEAPPDKDSAGEMQNSFEQVELGSSSADIVPADQPNHAAGEMQNSSEQVELASSLADVVPANQLNHAATCHPLDDPINTSDLPTCHPEASTVVSDQDDVQPHSHVELESDSHQVAMQAASNSDFTASGMRAQSSNPRNLPTPLEINNHPIQTAADSASRMLSQLCYDPLKNEFEKIQKEMEKALKTHEDRKLQLKSEYEKELAELRRKYDIKNQEVDIEFQRTKKTLDTNLSTVCVNKILADAFRSKCLDLKVSGASRMQRDSSSTHQLLQLSRQQIAARALVSGSSSSTTSLRSSSTAANSHHMVPPTQAGVSARPLLINSRPSPVRDIPASSEMCAPAPHLQSYRPSPSVPPSNFPAPLHGMQSPPTPSNVPAISPKFSQGLPRPRPTIYPSDPQTRRRPDNVVGLAAPNLPAMDLRGKAGSQSTMNFPNALYRMTDVATGNLSRFGTSSSSSMLANSSKQATTPEFVCLLDNDN